MQNNNEETQMNSNALEAEKNSDMDCLPPPPVISQNPNDNLGNINNLPQKNVKLNDQQFKDFIELILNLNQEQKNKLREVLLNDVTPINEGKHTNATLNKKSGQPTNNNEVTKSKSNSTLKKKVALKIKIATQTYILK